MRRMDGRTDGWMDEWDEVDHRPERTFHGLGGRGPVMFLCVEFSLDLGRGCFWFNPARGRASHKLDFMLGSGSVPGGWVGFSCFKVWDTRGVEFAYQPTHRQYRGVYP